MKVYVGHRTEEHDWVVTLVAPGTGASAALNPRFDLRRHSPDGFSWGYSGSGPAQLALALCADVLNDDERAQNIYQRFKDQVVAVLDQDADWTLSEVVIREQIELIAKEGP